MSTLGVGLVALGLMAAAAAGLAQPADAPGRAEGRVTGPDERPVAGALVALHPVDDPAGGPPPARTDGDGRWRLPRLRPGRHAIRVEARGFVPAEGWVQVNAGAVATVDVELRSLAEGTPRFSEGSASTLQRWLEKGNALLAQGQAAAARAEFERALGALPLAGRPEVLQAIARTHFLEGDAGAAVEKLTAALRIAPGDEDLRALFGALLGELGRGDEVASLLAEIEAVGPGPEPQPVAPPSGPRLELPPLVEAGPGRLGSYRTAFAERHPLSSMEAYRERFGLASDEIAALDPAMGEYDLTAESFEVFVPELPAAGGYGLLVYVSPTYFGGFFRPEVAEVLSRRGVIWVGADNAGNRRPAWYRAALALDAVHNLGRLYDIDEERIWVTGYSGGGRVASSLAVLYPEVFRGGLFSYGCDYFRRLRLPDKPGAYWPPRFPEPPPESLERIRRESRLVYLTGERDFNRAQTKATWKQAVSDGFRHATYLEIPGADHYAGIPGEWLERAFEALEGR